MIITRNHRRAMQCTCARCGTKKTRFMSGEGFFGDLAKSVGKKLIGVAAKPGLKFLANKLGGTKLGKYIPQDLLNQGADYLGDQVQDKFGSGFRAGGVRTFGRGFRAGGVRQGRGFRAGGVRY
jgi:hypothetical protein